MSADAFALVLGTVLACAALAFVLQPLFMESAGPSRQLAAPARRSAEDSAVSALREIEFDRATGKLSDMDYDGLRSTYAERAIREMRGGLADVAEGVEARVRAYRLARRECLRCGLRPEPAAVYCSSCGEFLDRQCPDCGTVISGSGVRFCPACGGRVGRDRR